MAGKTPQKAEGKKTGKSLKEKRADKKKKQSERKSIYDAPRRVAHTRVYCKGVLEAEDFPVADISDHLDRPDTVVWVDYCAPSPEEMEELKEELGFHELAVEDALGQHQRPKLERYPGHLFLVCHAVRLDEVTGDLASAEIDAFINSRWLVTVRKDEGFDLEPVLTRWDRSKALATHGVSFLLYGLLDVVIDGYFQPIDRFNEYYDAIGEEIFDERPLQGSERQRWFRTRKSLIEFHRLVMPMREVVSSLLRREQTLVPEELYPYYQDVYDHTLRATESSEAVRDLVSTIVESNISLPRLPEQPDHEEGDELGRDHRGPHTDHRLVRDERAVPGVCSALGGVGGHHPDLRALPRALRPVREERLAVAGRSPSTTCALTSGLPRSYEVLVGDRIKFRVGRIVYLAFSRDETLMGFAFPKEEREAALETYPDKFLRPEAVRHALPVARRSPGRHRQGRAAGARLRRLAHGRAEEGGRRAPRRLTSRRRSLLYS